MNLKLQYEFSANLSKNLSPTAAILSSYLFDQFSYKEKCTYLHGLKSRLLSPDLVRFCISNLEGVDTFLELFGLPRNGNITRTTYTLEPFDDISSLLEDLKTKFRIFEPCDNQAFKSAIDDYCTTLNTVQQLLVFDFYEFHLTDSFGKYIESSEFKEDKILKIEFVTELLKCISSMELCNISDVMYSMFFTSILYNDEKLTFNPRLIQYIKMEYGKQYLDHGGFSTIYDDCSADKTSIKHLLEIITEKIRFSNAPYKVLEHALFPHIDEARDIFTRFIDRNKDIELEACAFFLNTNNYSIGPLVNEVLENYTPVVHNKWSDDNWMGGYFGNHVVSMLSNPNSIYHTGRYFNESLLGKSDPHSLLILSAIANISPLPPAISTHINNYVFHQLKSGSNLINRFRNSSSLSEYEENKAYSDKYGNDIEFLSNSFDGFKLDNSHLFFDTHTPSSKDELNTFLVFASGAVEVVKHITNLRKEFLEYLNNEVIEGFWDMGVNERLPLLMEFKRENFHSEYIIKELESERVRSCINVNALHKNEFDELGLLFRIVGNEDEQFINDIMTLSPLSSTDLLGAHRTQVLISKSRDESKSSIEDLNKNIKEGRVLQEESIDARFRKISDELYLMKEEMHNGKEEISKSRNFIVESLRVPKRSSFHILNFILLTVVLVLILLR